MYCHVCLRAKSCVFCMFVFVCLYAVLACVLIFSFFFYVHKCSFVCVKYDNMELWETYILCEYSVPINM